MPSDYNTRFATVLRLAQWEIEEAAHHMGAGRFTQEQCQSLADSLEPLVIALRLYPLEVPAETHRRVDDGPTSF